MDDNHYSCNKLQWVVTSVTSKSDREREREREIDQYFVLYWQEHFTFKINFHKEISATHLHTQEHMCNIHFVLQDMHALE